MATPEQEPKVPEAVQEVQDRFSPEVEKRLQEIGAQVRPTAPQQPQDDQGQATAQPADDTFDPSAQTVTVPVSQEQATAWSHGSATDSRTWLGVVILRRIKKALHFGWRIIIGKKQ